jgi:hypothetical protein
MPDVDVVEKKRVGPRPRVMTTTMNMRVDPKEIRRWKAAAKRAGLGLSAWIRSILDVAASDGDDELSLFTRRPALPGTEANR